MFDTGLLTPRLVQEKDALLQFQVMAWLVHRARAPVLPSIPSPLNRSPAFEDLFWSEADSRSVFDWADDSFAVIKSECRMADWNVTVIPDGEGIYPLTLTPLHRLSASQTRTPYVVDLHGRPVFFYDPRDCEEPGYFSACVIMKLAELYLADFNDGCRLPLLTSRIARLTAACYAGQGFTLANLLSPVLTHIISNHEGRYVPTRNILNTICFSTCLALRIRGQSTETILSTYSGCMPSAFRRRVKRACRQIDAYEPELKILQVLCRPAPHPATRPERLKRAH